MTHCHVFYRSTCIWVLYTTPLILIARVSAINNIGCPSISNGSKVLARNTRLNPERTRTSTRPNHPTPRKSRRIISAGEIWRNSLGRGRRPVLETARAKSHATTDMVSPLELGSSTLSSSVSTTSPSSSVIDRCPGHSSTLHLQHIFADSVEPAGRLAAPGHTSA